MITTALVVGCGSEDTTSTVGATQGSTTMMGSTSSPTTTGEPTTDGPTGSTGGGSQSGSSSTDPTTGDVTTSTTDTSTTDVTASTGTTDDTTGTTGPAPFCGDGEVDDGEECDDGNDDDTDSCVAGCKAATCGDGFVGPGELCDDGNDVDDDECGNTCTLASCGDGKVQPGEECDDGNDVDTDACLPTCKSATCGDGKVQADVEECDDGNTDDGDDCTPTCELPTCSDNAKNGAETDVDCGGPMCPKCGLGDACDGQPDCGQGVCNDNNVCALPKSCNELKTLKPNTPDGEYMIDPDGDGDIAPLMVRCEMDADACGYTMVRFNDAALAGSQDAYAAKCAAVGMEIVVTRTKNHAQALFDWNGGEQANLLNIFPNVNGAQGIINWTGRCQGQPCSFWMTDNANGDVGCLNFEPNGDNNTMYRIYRRQAGCGLQGNWNDANNTVGIHGWVICSPNDC